VRDAFARFLDNFISKKPIPRSILHASDVDEGTYFSPEVLQKMNGDMDLRVRFRVATIHGRLFSQCKLSEQDKLYQSVSSSVTAEIDKYASRSLIFNEGYSKFHQF